MTLRFILGKDRPVRSKGLLERYLRRHARTLLSAVVLSGLSGLITMGLLAYTNKLAANGLHDGRTALLYAGAMLGGLLLISIATQVLLARLGAYLVEQLRTELAHQFLRIDYEKFARRNNVVFGAVIQDLERIGPLVLMAPQLAYNTLLIVLFSGYLIKLSVVLYLIFTAFISVAILASLLVSRFTRSQFDAMRSAEERFFEHLRTMSEGKKEFSLSRARVHHFTEVLLRPAIAQARVLMTRVHLAWGVNDSCSTVVLNGAVFMVVLLGYTMLGLGSTAVVQFVIAGLFLVGPLSFLVQVAQPVGLGLASLRHLERIGLDLQADAPPPYAPCANAIAHREWRLVQVDDVVYRYPQTLGTDLALGVGPVSFRIRRGEILFLVGGNGSGKSTLLLLLCGLLAPQQGRILLDGQPVQEDLEGYRGMFCGTFSDCFVFRHVLDSTGNLKDDAEVEVLLRRFGLEGQVRVDRGELSRLELSTGQRKRLALIQSFAQDREIYFFDEWAADQDPSFRDAFYSSVLPELKQRGKTVIVISHDDRYFHRADRVLKLDSGLIVSDTGPQTAPNDSLHDATHPLGAFHASPLILVRSI